MMEVTNQDNGNGRSSFDAASQNVSPSIAGTKRLFSNRGSKQLNDYEDAIEFVTGEGGIQSGKRPRNSDWPLPKASPPSARLAQRYRNGTNSPPARRARSQIRSSKFMEGSMNDKISKKPPPPYIDDEDIREQYDEEEAGRGRSFARLRKPNHHNEESSVTGRSEASKHSIFRFGKSIAATFNPTNWKIWNKQAQIPENEETVQQRILRERQEKAARVYQELKASGEFRDTAIGTDFYEPIDPKGSHASRHGSVVNFNENAPTSSRNSGEHSQSRDENRRGQLFQETPNQRNNLRSESPASNFNVSVSQSSQSSPKFKKPSLLNLRRSFANDSTPSLSNGEYRQARRIPSRKELVKQQRLVKRVSDLESKLEEARRQLIDAVGEPVHTQVPHTFERGRPRFVPGALPSLPSERLLSGYVTSDDEEIGRAVTANHPLFKHPIMNNSLIKDEMPKNSHSAVPSADKLLPSVENDTSVAASVASHIPETVVPSRFDEFNDEEDEGEQENTPKPKSALLKKRKSVERGRIEEIITATVEEEDEETPKKLAVGPPSPPSRAAPQPPKATRSRKRKSFVGHADDGGEYEPDSQPELDSESELSAATSDSGIGFRNKSQVHGKFDQRTSTSTPAKHTITLTRPRKLQKNSPTTSSPKGAQTQPPARKKSLKDLKPTAAPQPSMPASAPNRLVKSKIPNLAPPEPYDSDFSGLQYSKPSTARSTPVIHEDGDVEDVPPVPKLPKTVRMPSGEIVSTANSNLIAKKKGGSVVSKASSNGAKLTKTKKEVKTEEKENEASLHGKQSFEWPEDVF